MFKQVLVGATLGAMMIGSAASALTAQQSVYKEVQTTDANGVIRTERVAADLITPGERVVYALTYKNDKAEAADDIVLTMPVPAAVTFVDGTATTEQASLVYSADNGDSFASRDDVLVIGADGAMRTAKAAEITHVRWTVNQTVAPGAQGELSFTGLLK